MADTDTSTNPAPPLADQAKEQAQHVAEAGKQAGAQVVQQGKQMAGSLLDRTRDQTKTLLGTQKDNVATGLNDVAQALMLSSNHLQEQGQGGVAHYGDQAAEQITKLSGYLRDRDVDEVLDEVQGFARQQPGLFIGGAVLLGLAAARFLKSSGGVGTPPAAPMGTSALVPAVVSPSFKAAQSGMPDGTYEGEGVGQQEIAGHYAVRDGDVT